MSQNSLVLRWLQAGHGITSRQAIDQFGITRLAARIAALRAAGNDIEASTVTVRNRYGKPVHVARYRLVQKVAA